MFCCPYYHWYYALIRLPTQQGLTSSCDLYPPLSLNWVSPVPTQAFLAFRCPYAEKR